ncbi:hypothetical protein SAMN05421821_106146 [Mucilaginibacter lappiensis]|uniref:Uncharacterized protein n=1 Tax=Mucilaginibacter lappiensis TaxID=354630 RepID=A0ABR6PL39_9SPHI|nr:hypothetical protein [Mucilaginibacter lappiensis]SIR30829.1 hypothetical protein SAMN05421821_106146 [Mucilaginibacter lappiensis]
MCKLFSCTNVQISHMWVAAYKDAMGLGPILKSQTICLKSGFTWFTLFMVNMHVYIYQSNSYIN